MSIETFTRTAFPSLRNGGAAEIASAARAAGHAAGYLEGLRAGAEVAAQRAHFHENARLAVEDADRARVDAAITTLATAAQSLEQRTIATITDVQGALAAAAVDIAEAVLGRELESGDASARSAVARALGGVDAERVSAIRLNPDDLADLNSASTRDSSARSLGSEPTISSVTFVADPSLARGDAVTEFDDGFLDARIGTAFDRVRSVLAVSS